MGPYFAVTIPISARQSRPRIRTASSGEGDPQSRRPFGPEPLLSQPVRNALPGPPALLQNQIDAPAPIELVFEPDPFVQIHRQRAMRAIAPLARVSFAFSSAEGDLCRDCPEGSGALCCDKTGRTE